MNNLFRGFLLTLCVSTQTFGMEWVYPSYNQSTKTNSQQYIDQLQNILRSLDSWKKFTLGDWKKYSSDTYKPTSDDFRDHYESTKLKEVFIQNIQGLKFSITWKNTDQWSNTEVQYSISPHDRSFIKCVTPICLNTELFKNEAHFKRVHKTVTNLMNKIVKSLSHDTRTFASYFIENSILQHYPDLLLINQENNSSTLDEAYKDLEALIKNLITEYQQQEQTTKFQEIQKNCEKIIAKNLSCPLFPQVSYETTFLILKELPQSCINDLANQLIPLISQESVPENIRLFLLWNYLEQPKFIDLVIKATAESPLILNVISKLDNYWVITKIRDNKKTYECSQLSKELVAIAKNNKYLTANARLQALTASWELNHEQVSYAKFENDPQVSAHIVDAIPYTALSGLTSKDGWNFLKPFLTNKFYKNILVKLSENKINNYNFVDTFLLPTVIERFESENYRYGRVDHDFELEILNHCSLIGKQKHSRTLNSFIEVYLPERYKSDPRLLQLKQDIAKTAQDELATNECIICNDMIPISDKFTLSCGHNQFCETCISGWLRQHKTCPVCREVNTNDIYRY